MSTQALKQADTRRGELSSPGRERIDTINDVSKDGVLSRCVDKLCDSIVLALRAQQRAEAKIVR